MNYDQSIYLLLRDTLIPLLQIISGKLTTIENAINSFSELASRYWQMGLMIGLFAFLWFFTSKFVQSILYK